MSKKIKTENDFRKEIETLKERIEDEQNLIEDYQYKIDNLEYRISYSEDEFMKYVHQNRVDELEMGIIEIEDTIDEFIYRIETILSINLDKLTKEELREFNKEFDIKNAA
ncbi:MAG: hypothetical protein O2U61_01100 [Candidatus Bathyarchaeota archaeon]|nr:hypothetical protein [Candidatus Bathyarchaeota archaeon]